MSAGRCPRASPSGPGPDRRRDPALGERRHRRHQLHAQRAGGDPAGRGARQHAPVRRRGDAEVPVVKAARPLLTRRGRSAGTASRSSRPRSSTPAQAATFLPAGLVPTNPTLVTLLAIHVPGGPHGPFTMAQVRLSCRSGARARALVVATAVDAAARPRRGWPAGWGIGGRRGRRLRAPLRPGAVRAPWFDVALEAPPDRRRRRPVRHRPAPGRPTPATASPRWSWRSPSTGSSGADRCSHSFNAPAAAAGARPTLAVVATSAVGK